MKATTAWFQPALTLDRVECAVIPLSDLPVTLLRIVSTWSDPSGAVSVDADERDEFIAELVAAVSGAA